MAHRATRWMLMALLSLATMPVFAKDPEERLAFQRSDPPEVTIMFADGSGMADLGPSRYFSNPCVTPALSPDGRSIAFAARVGDQSKIFVWHLDEHNTAVGEPKRLTAAESDMSEKFPVWSPDGKRLAFVSTDRFNKSTLRVVNADGSSMIALTSINYFASPAWSPDGQQLLFVNMLGERPVLHNICVTGGKALPMHQDSKITAACYSPDGKQIAALVQRDNGTSDLSIIPPFGIGGQVVVNNIVGAKSVSWRKADTITFNAAKAGNQTGKAFWMISPKGDNLRGITGYADPKQVAYFSLANCDLTPYVPVALAPTATKNAAPAPQKPVEQTLPNKPEEDQVDVAEVLVAHAVTVLSPWTESTVRGIVPLNIIARKNVAKVNILIGGRLVYSALTANTGAAVPRMTYYWNTQSLKALEPGDSLPKNYDDALLYPDGPCTVCAQGFDQGNKLVDQHIITLNVANLLPNTIVPGGTTALEYKFSEDNPDEYFRVHADGLVLSDAVQQQPQQPLLQGQPMPIPQPQQGQPQQPQLQQGQLPELSATLDVAFKRSFVEASQNNMFGFMTEIRPLSGRYPLVYGQNQASLPEFYAKGAYALNKYGDLSVVPINGDKAYLPLAQLMVPLKNTAAKVGDTWTKPMSVVTDLFDREATTVNAVHSLDGFEWINGKQTARIRSDYRVNSDFDLRNTPATTVPATRGTRSAAIKNALKAGQDPNMPPTMGGQAPGVAMPTPDMSAGLAAPMETTAKKIEGVRYSWYDLTDHKLVRVEDMVLHTIPIDVTPPDVLDPFAAVPGDAPGITIDDARRARQQQQGQKPKRQYINVWYLVHYQYTAFPAPKKADE